MAILFGLLVALIGSAIGLKVIPGYAVWAVIGAAVAGLFVCLGAWPKADAQTQKTDDKSEADAKKTAKKPEAKKPKPRDWFWAKAMVVFIAIVIGALVVLNYALPGMLNRVFGLSISSPITDNDRPAAVAMAWRPDFEADIEPGPIYEIRMGKPVLAKIFDYTAPIMVMVPDEKNIGNWAELPVAKAGRIFVWNGKTDPMWVNPMATRLLVKAKARTQIRVFNYSN
ncbi:MAG: hypothetical protein ACOZBH_01400 [Patescibacteria group bacterium]